ncbi:MAG: hypothetical protein JJT96_03165 [Opitutales bacterium]|nr:hypothetical protein [Opitutales bacterium]
MRLPMTFRRLLVFLLALAAGLAPLSHLTAQSGPESDDESSDAAFPPPPEDEDVPPPPDFIPPPAPTGPRPVRTPVTRPGARPTPSPVDADATTATAANLVSRADPRMAESVGLLRIPGLGTNEVLEILENFTRKPILRQQNLPAVNIVFMSQSAMTRGDAILAIESLLALNGIAITDVGDRFLKAVPASAINSQVPPQWIGTTLDATPSQKLYEKIFNLEFLTAQEAVPLIQPLMSVGAPIAFDKSNLLLVTDALINLQRLERLLAVLDAPKKLRTEMLFFQLSNISAQDVLRRLQQLQTGALRRQLENNTHFDADDRTNQLIVFTHPSNAELITSLIERIDVNVAPLTNTRVFNIQHAQAPDVVSLIDQVISGQKQARDASQSGTRTAPGSAAARAAAQRTGPQQPQPQVPSTLRGEASTLQFSDFMTLVADERANTIVASGTETDLRFLETLIREIDTVLAQVRIEVVITEVTITNDYSRGLDAFGIQTNVAADYRVSESAGRIAPRLNAVGGPNTVISPDIVGGSLRPIIFGPGELSIDLVLQTGRVNNNVKVLSSPTIVTTHNREGSISITRRIPVITGTVATDTDLGLGNIRQNVQYTDVGIDLKVTPLIGSNGVVQLEIEQSISSETGAVGAGNNPIFTSRDARSYVSVGNGQMVVLGGLQQLDSTDGEARIMFLGDIPVLGNLFRRRTEAMTRSELLIFIRPYIVGDVEAAHLDAQERLRLIESSDEVQRFLDTGTFRPPEPEPEERTSPRRRHGS